MLLNPDYVSTTPDAGLMEKLDVVQRMALCTPDDTYGCMCGFCASHLTPQAEEDSRPRGYTLTAESKSILNRLADLVPMLNAPVDWQTVVGPMPAHRFVVGPDSADHAVDIDAELATAAFVEHHRIQSLFPDHYKDVDELLR